MKKVFHLWLLILLPFTATFAQNNLPSFFEIKTDTATYTTLPDSCWKMLEDKKNKLSFEEVKSSPIANQFHYNNTKNNELNYSINTYWFLYRLKNAMSQPVNISFNSGNEHSKFFFIKNGKLTQLENGILSRWVKLNGLSSNGSLPIELNPGEEIIVYNRVNNTYNFYLSPNRFSVGFGFTKNLLNDTNINDERLYINGIHDSILFGILLFASLFNFFFFLIVKERVYLYFSLYLIFLGVGRMPDEFYFVFLREFRVLWIYLFQDVIWPFTFFILTFFIRSLLNTRSYLPRWDKFLNGLNYFNIIVQILPSALVYFLYVPTIFFNIELLVRILLIICNILSFFLILNKQGNVNKVLMRAILPAFFIWGMGYSMEIIYLSYGYILLSADLTNWLHNWWYVIETICLSWMVIFYSWVLLQRFRQLQKKVIQHAFEKEKEKSELIKQQKIELEKTVEERTSELKKSLDNLRETQSQLIQSEKMASLGELTAGIAHEIQNPLNFVNNFSEVNTELIDELKTELATGNPQQAIEIADNIKDNEQKINHHGKRADAIVKGMLQHSRSSTGVKEPTDINALADEYLRLSYHGLRAKDKSFNANFKTDFDETIGKINIIPQDIGRVLLNLFNNAFYAVTEKAKQQPNGYEPTILVSTKKVNNTVELTVKDNGNGIPQKVLDKIFQPFFTTKPTGEGTGLGLSLSYDIIKAHGGEIKVETKEGEETAFVIQIPSK